jgi:hypothetical protein
MDSKGKELLDSVSTEYEDSFSLEEFGDLCKTYQTAEPAGSKSFIIARVETRDLRQPDKVN